MHSWPKQQMLAFQLHEHLFQVNVTILILKHNTSTFFPEHILTSVHFANPAPVIKYLEPILLYLNNTGTERKISIKVGSISEDIMKQKDKRENLMKAQFSKRCLQYVAGGNLTLSIVLLLYLLTYAIGNFFHYSSVQALCGKCLKSGCSIESFVSKAHFLEPH